jgi:hypothetical protein
MGSRFIISPEQPKRIQITPIIEHLILPCRQVGMSFWMRTRGNSLRLQHIPLHGEGSTQVKLRDFGSEFCFISIDSTTRQVTSGLDHTQLLPHLLKRLQTFSQIIIIMRGGDHDSDASFALCHRGISNCHGKDAFFE